MACGKNSRSLQQQEERYASAFFAHLHCINPPMRANSGTAFLFVDLLYGSLDAVSERVVGRGWRARSTDDGKPKSCEL